MVKYTDYLPENSSRNRENIEWVIFYSFNAPDEKSPRVLTVGDSICYQYKEYLHEIMSDKVNVTSWASSKCVTDVTYLKDLEHILEYNRYDFITFNNGLHYLTEPTSFSEWEAAYRKTLEYIQAKLPAVPIALLSCTPVNNPEKNAIVIELNKITAKIAADTGLPLIDLYSEMDKLDRSCWSDEFHFKEDTKKIQAEFLAKYISAKLEDVIKRHSQNLTQKSSPVGPDGAIA